MRLRGCAPVRESGGPDSLFRGKKETGRLGNEEQKKALSDIVYRVRKNHLDYAGRNAADIGEMQRILKEQAALRRYPIEID